jgi:ribose 1,5-bisphosphokinase PhnN
MTFRSAGHTVLTSLGKSEFVQRAHQYMCAAKWRMHAYECGLKTAMINVTGGNAWLIDDASVSLLYFSLSLSLNHRTRHGPHQS